MFGLIVLFAFIFVLFSIARTPPPNKQELLQALKVCPPHRWRYEEVKDTDGNTVKWKMICDVCGPLKPLDAPERMNY